MAKSRGRLKLSELVKRTGVGRGTIQHYLREGLLPAPVKTSPNMAYYDASCVERIRLIKDLQTRRHLPLAAIRPLLASLRSDGALARTLTEAQSAALAALSPPTRRSMTAAAAARAFGLRPELIAELARVGIVDLVEERGQRVLPGRDLEVVAAIANLDRLGLSERLGFAPADLLVYRDKLSELLDRELQTFVQVMARAPVDPATIPGLAAGAVEGATMLILALRRKLVADRLGLPDPWELVRFAGLAPGEDQDGDEAGDRASAGPPDDDEPG